ncbi:MAG TPA: hypothetical protein DIT76_04510 [Spartobacteria bacterium]|jgi:hypothetical protein|nr:hypothetical protein [Spartobacteria bacterium]HCP91297.1 hypothetical protein [Spartobacteria bacterium]
MTKLICSECGHENEAERIYCHSCGARLDRTATTLKAPREGLKETQRRVRNMFDPTRVKIRLFFFRISKFILGACATAAVIQMVLPPDVPPPVKAILLPSQISLELENAITYHRPAQLQFTEEQVNAYFASALKSKQSSLNKPLLDFKRAIIGFGEGKVAITAERSLFGLSLYSGSLYAINLKEGKIAASNKGGSIGRLPIRPEIMQFMDFIFADLWSAVERERKLVAKMGAIEFHQNNVLLNAPSQ